MQSTINLTVNNRIKVTKCKKCGKVIAEPKELIEFGRKPANLARISNHYYVLVDL